jgi:hypothetical protein
MWGTKGGRSGGSAERCKLFRAFRWRLSAESRIPHGQLVAPSLQVIWQYEMCRIAFELQEV